MAKRNRLRGQPGRLTPLEVKRLAKIPGRHADGGNLFLQTTLNPQHGYPRSSWTFGYTKGGVDHAMGLGSLHTVTLKMARAKAAEYRALLIEGIDPSAHRKAQHQAAALQAVATKTFDEVRDEYFHKHKDKWRSDGFGGEWMSSMRRYVTPSLGKLPIDSIDRAKIIETLEKDGFWNAKPSTASKVRGRIHDVIGFAMMRGWHGGPNPATWKGVLSTYFVSRSRLAPVQHHPATPYGEVGAFLDRLREKGGSVAAAIEFIVLTASRRREVLAAKWDEIDGDVWVVPAERMKSRREHRVPLSSSAKAVLERQRAAQRNEFIFPGVETDHVRPNAVKKLLARLEFGYTLHGFRSSFRDWTAEETTFEADTAEAALAHAVGDSTRQAYERGARLAKRASLMQAWSDFVTGKVAKPTQLRAVS